LPLVDMADQEPLSGTPLDGDPVSHRCGGLAHAGVVGRLYAGPGLAGYMVQFGGNTPTITKRLAPNCLSVSRSL
jgi:hypothetical protein